MKKENSDLKKEIIQRAADLLSSMMPRNTNWHSFTAREKAAEIVVEMMMKDYKINVWLCILLQVGVLCARHLNPR